MSCCVTIRPQYVIQWNWGRSASWSPFGQNFNFNGSPYSEDWDEAFDETNIITSYPEELKQECHRVGGAESYEITTAYDDDANCQEVNPWNQSVSMAFKLDVCQPIHMKFLVEGNVERKDFHFDWIWVVLTPINADGSFGDPQVLLYEHGTNENVDCEMAEKSCCKSIALAPGQYYLQINQATGDGWHHDDHYWHLLWEVNCASATTCGSDPECETDEDEPPIDPPSHELPTEGEPPAGSQQPGPDNPDPESRGDCSCSACELQAIGVQISGLADSNCTSEFACLTTETASLIASLNGGYVLTFKDALDACNPGGVGEWSQLLGCKGDVDNMGILIGTDTTDCHNEDPLCIFHGDPERTGICAINELYVWKISGVLTCIECEVGEAAGLRWEGDISFHLQCRGKFPLNDPPDDEWFLGSDIACAALFNIFCANLTMENLVNSPCEAPPSCFGSVTYDNGANTGLDEICECDVVGSTATLTMQAIGLSKLCNPL